MPSVAASGTQTAVIGTEHVLYTSVGSGTYVFAINTLNMAQGDVVEVRIKSKVLPTGTLAVVYKQSYENSQNPNAVAEDLIKISVPFPSDLSGDQFTLKQIAGVGRDFPWKVLTLP